MQWVRITMPDKEGLNFQFNVFGHLKDQMAPKSTGPYMLIL